MNKPRTWREKGSRGARGGNLRLGFRLGLGSLLRLGSGLLRARRLRGSHLGGGRGRGGLLCRLGRLLRRWAGVGCRGRGRGRRLRRRLLLLLRGLLRLRGLLWLLLRLVLGRQRGRRLLRLGGRLLGGVLVVEGRLQLGGGLVQLVGGLRLLVVPALTVQLRGAQRRRSDA